MKKIVGILFLALTINGFAQETADSSARSKKVKTPKTEKVVTNQTPKSKIDFSKIDLSKRVSDHFMFQFGLAGWAGKPSNITTSVFNRTFNGYFLFDFPFKTNPRLSVAVGPGVGTDNIYFKDMTVDLNNRNGATFTRDTVIKYKKHKLATGYVEAPVELRYSTNPQNMNKGWKIALGVKVGTMIDAKVKSKIDLDATGTGGYFTKEKDRRYLNTTRVALTGRIGWGNISAFGTYTLTDFFKEGQGPVVRPFSVGLAVSGL